MWDKLAVHKCPFNIQFDSEGQMVIWAKNIKLYVNNYKHGDGVKKWGYIQVYSETELQQ
jgi:hypothetical protein